MPQGDEIIFRIDRWLGVNESPDGDVDLKTGEAAVMRNWRVTGDGNLRTRPGWKTVARFSVDSGQWTVDSGETDPDGICPPIRGMWAGRVKGEESLFVAVGGHVWRFADHWPLATDHCEPLGSLTDDTTSFFGFNDKLYVLNGHEYKVWDGEGELRDVEGYVPLVAVATPPGGGGTVLEPVNLLTGRKRQRFSPYDGAVVYKLLEDHIDAVERVTVGGAPVTEYIADLVAGTVIFKDAPDEVWEHVPDSVEIWWDKAARDIQGEPVIPPMMACRYAEIFGGATDSRVFLYGDGGATVWHSGLDGAGLPTAEYYPVTGFLQVDSANVPVTGLVRQQDRLVVCKADSLYYISVGEPMKDALGNAVPAFTLLPLNGAVGHLAPGQARLVTDSPAILTENSAWEVVATNVRDQRSVVDIGQRARRTLASFDMEKAVTWNDLNAGELIIAYDGRAAIFNYGVGAWYIYDNLPAVCFASWGGGLCFGTGDGRVCLMRDGFRNDDGQPVDAHWESGSMDFGENWRRKFTDMLWVVTKPDGGGRVIVTGIADPYIGHMEYLVSAGLATFAHADFRHWSFNVNRRPKSRKRKLRLRRFAFFKLILRSDTDSAAAVATVMSVAIKVRFGGETR